MEIKKLLKKYSSEILVILIGIFFGSVIMFTTFSEENNQLLIATKVWSDFASHIPLIRSFSLGNNFPPQYPLFPGENIKYHFVFYAIVGLLEKIGIRIDIGLNLLSVAGFTALVILIYLLSKELFKSKKIGIVSVIFFLFNSSLSFIYFFNKFPLSNQTINQIISNHDFLSFAPYGPGIISAFWNLNIYTNQRHLAFSFALSIGIILFLLKQFNGSLKIKKDKLISFFLGVVLGFSFFLHIAVFLMTTVVIFSLGLLFKKARINAFLILIPAALIAFPQYKYLTATVGYQMHLLFGYLISDNLSINKLVQFWIFNLGLSTILIPVGFIFSNKKQKKIFIPFFILFLVGNFIQFSPEIAANHKFFNYFIIIGNVYSAYVIYKLWDKKNYIFKLISVSLFMFMILGGIIDFFPIINDQKVRILDYKTDERAQWIKNNTSPNSIFLNTTFLYDPASLVGRKIFMGWPYFAWSQGYDTYKRGDIVRKMLGSTNKSEACSLFLENKIDYVEIKIQDPPDPNVPPISNLYEEEFTKAYENLSNNYSIYSVHENCGL